MLTHFFKITPRLTRSLLFLVSLLLPGFALAAIGDYQLLAPLPTFNSSYNPSLFVKYVQNFITLSITLSAILAVAFITIGGFQWMGGESMQMKSDGKDKIQNAVLGLVILGASFLILNTINPALLNFKLEVPALITPGSDGSTQTSTSSAVPISGSERAAMQAAGQSEVLTESLAGANGNIDPAKVQDFGVRCTSQGGTVRYNVAINKTAHCIKSN